MNVQEQENDELQLEEQARERIKQQYYGKKQLLIYDDRFVNFDPDSKNDIVGGEKLTYDEYIDIQMRSPNDKGLLFICAIYTPISDFYGTIARHSKDKKRICFNRIFFTYMYPDGMTADAIEDHVWMDGADFASFAVGDSVSFYAEVYRYLKTGNGKQLAFGLRSPCGIRRCAPYALPSEKELRAQRMELSCCDNCYLGDCCSRVSCMLNRR